MIVMKNIVLTFFAGIGLCCACSMDYDDINVDLQGMPDAPIEGEAYVREITETDIDQMRAMLNAEWGWKSYFPCIINCWDPSAIRLSLYDLASFPRLSYDGKVTSLASLQLSVILQGTCEKYSPSLPGESMSKESSYIWDSFCADMDHTLDQVICDLIEEGTFWDRYEALTSSRSNKKASVGTKIFESNYSLRIIRSIRITSSSSLYGMDAGEDISSHFVLSGMSNYLPHEWNTLDGQFAFVDEPIEGMSFERFLEFRPHMRQLEIKLKDLPDERPDALFLTVSITYEDGDEVSASVTIQIG